MIDLNSTKFVFIDIQVNRVWMKKQHFFTYTLNVRCSLLTDIQQTTLYLE